jgi:hypothetical protein
LAIATSGADGVLILGYFGPYGFDNTTTPNGLIEKIVFADTTITSTAQAQTMANFSATAATRSRTEEGTPSSDSARVQMVKKLVEETGGKLADHTNSFR